MFSFIFLKANVLKYIPGNIFQYVGRNEVAMELGLNHLNVALASALEIVIIASITLTVSISTVGFYTVQYLNQWIVQNKTIILISIATVLLFAALAFIKAHSQVSAQFNRFVKAINTRGAKKNFLLALAYYFFFLMVNAFVFIRVLTLDSNTAISVESIPMLSGAYMLSWLIGYITPGAPGGIGIRELILITIIKNYGIATEPTVMQTVVIVRLTNIAGDILAFVMISCLRVFYRKYVLMSRKGEAR